MRTLYCGRFAPSPSGPLHFGSLITAVASYLDAKAHGGEWWVRIDDLDPPRVTPGAADAILRALEIYGLEWDGAVQYQRQRSEAYALALAELRRLRKVYPCICSRREIADSMIARAGSPIYPGTCRTGLIPTTAAARAVRVDTRGASVGFEDRLQGAVTLDLESDVGDFILQRADGLFAYQLAAVVDDAALGVTDIVRGADLLESSLRQLYLQRLLKLPRPRYLHLPVAVNALGEKLSKQTLAPPLDIVRPQPILIQALRFLNHQPPPALLDAAIPDILAWAVQNWSTARIPQVRSKEP